MLERRRRIRAISELELFPAQLRYRRALAGAFSSADGARMKAALCTRRAGKSHTVAVELVEDSQLFPGRPQFYFGLTQKSAEAAIWPLMRPLLEKYIGDSGPRTWRYSSVSKTVSFPNRSTIRFLGVDASPQDIKRVLGTGIHRAAFDEPQDYTQNLRTIVYDVVLPAIGDFLHDGGGWIEMTGTPGERMGEHLWHLVTMHDKAGAPHPERMRGWDVHEWGWGDNPGTRDELRSICDMLARDNANFANDPGFRRNFLGKWVTELDAAVYKYAASRNTLADERIRKSIEAKDDRWTFVLGCDLGYEDASAFALLAYAKDDPRVYVVRSRKVTHSVIGELAKIMREYVDDWGVERIVIDAGGGSGKLVAKTFQIEHDLPCVPADKLEKEASVAKMNSDFLGGRVQVLEGNEELCNEWSTLRLDRKARERGEWKEAEKFANHIADAALYAYKESKHPFASAPEEKAKRHSANDVYEDLVKSRAARTGDVNGPIFRSRPVQRERDFFDELDAEQDAYDAVQSFRRRRAG